MRLRAAWASFQTSNCLRYTAIQVTNTRTPEEMQQTVANLNTSMRSTDVHPA
jgi:hypothetical protein